jgi:hypothetical protein
MNEMVERVARAMYKGCDDDARHPTWDEVDHAFHNLWLRAARIGIAAMREPTEAMLEASPPIAGENPSKYEIWQAAIDEALK